MNIEPKLQALEEEFNETEKKMSDPEIISDPKEIQILGQKRAKLEPVVNMYREYKDAQKSIAEA